MECTVNRAASLYAAANNYVTLITYMHFLLMRRCNKRDPRTTCKRNYKLEFIFLIKNENFLIHVTFVHVQKNDFYVYSRRYFVLYSRSINTICSVEN